MSYLRLVQIVAVGSRDLSKSKEWADANVGANSGVTAYGSYDEVVADPVIISQTSALGSLA